MSVLPRTLPPPSLVLAKVPGLPTLETFPLVRTPKDEPSVGKPVSGVVDTPSGVPLGGIETKDAPVTFAEGDAIACAIASAPVGVIVAWAAPTTVSTANASAAAVTPRERADLIMMHLLPIAESRGRHGAPCALDLLPARDPSRRRFHDGPLTEETAARLVLQTTSYIRGGSMST
jgi:hypothetical protein